MARKRNFVLLLSRGSRGGSERGEDPGARPWPPTDPERWPSDAMRRHDRHGRTATPIKHVVVIFQENVSFDHYFGTYPKAANTDGQRFKARQGHARGRRADAGDRRRRCRRSLRHTSDLLTTQPQRGAAAASGQQRRPAPRRLRADS